MDTDTLRHIDVGRRKQGCSRILHARDFIMVDVESEVVGCSQHSQLRRSKRGRDSSRGTKTKRGGGIVQEVWDRRTRAAITATRCRPKPLLRGAYVGRHRCPEGIPTPPKLALSTAPPPNVSSRTVSVQLRRVIQPLRPSLTQAACASRSRCESIRSHRKRACHVVSASRSILGWRRAAGVEPTALSSRAGDIDQD